MEPDPRKLEDLRALDELIEQHLQAIYSKLAGPYTLYEIESELAKLTAVIDSFKRRDELLEKLIDKTTPEEKRRQIREKLKELHVKVAENRLELEQLHAKSHQNLERSRFLVLKARRLLYKKAYKDSDYDVETCYNCAGTGLYDGGRCLLCEDTGIVIVPKLSGEQPR